MTRLVISRCRSIWSRNCIDLARLISHQKVALADGRTSSPASSQTVRNGSTGAPAPPVTSVYRQRRRIRSAAAVGLTPESIGSRTSIFSLAARTASGARASSRPAISPGRRDGRAGRRGPFALRAAHGGEGVQRLAGGPPISGQTFSASSSALRARNTSLRAATISSVTSPDMPYSFPTCPSTAR